MPFAITTLKKSLPGPIAPFDEVMVRRVLWTLLPKTDGMQKRYEDAVSAVSAFLPILAFELRSKDIVGPWLAHIHSALHVDPNAAPMWLMVEDQLIELTSPKLDELIKNLAALHGRKTAKAVRTLLEQPTEGPPQIENMLKEAFASAAATQKLSAANSATSGKP
jgi:hypothetical protein